MIDFGLCFIFCTLNLSGVAYGLLCSLYASDDMAGVEMDMHTQLQKVHRAIWRLLLSCLVSHICFHCSYVWQTFISVIVLFGHILWLEIFIKRTLYFIVDIIYYVETMDKM